MPLDSWIIQEILRYEREKRERQEQPVKEIEEPQQDPETDDDGSGAGHEMPVNRGPRHEMPGPDGATLPAKKKDRESGRGVVHIPISGGDVDTGDDHAVVIDMGNLPKLPDGPEKEAQEERPGKKPD